MATHPASAALCGEWERHGRCARRSIMADMTADGRTRAPFREIVRSSLRSVATIVVLTAIYFLLPLNRTSSWVDVSILVIGLALLIVLAVLQVRSVMSAAYPVLRAVESLAVSVPLFVLLFAGTYVAMEGIAATSFSQPLTHIDALYFTVTVFATVGFGDITPTSEAARVVTTSVCPGCGVCKRHERVKFGRTPPEHCRDVDRGGRGDGDQLDLHRLVHGQLAPSRPAWSSGWVAGFPRTSREPGSHSGAAGVGRVRSEELPDRAGRAERDLRPRHIRRAGARPSRSGAVDGDHGGYCGDQCHRAGLCRSGPRGRAAAERAGHSPVAA